MKNPEPSERVGAHLEAALARAMSSMTGQEFVVRREEQKKIDALDDPIVWQQAFSLNPDVPAFWLMAGKDLWSAAGRLTLAAVGIDSASDEDCRSTWHEIAGQTIGGLASACTAELGREITAAKGEEVPAGPESADWQAYSATQGDQVWYFKVAWSRTLEAFWEQESNAAAQAKAPSEAKSVPGVNAFSRTFDLLLDVALPVSVSFGRTSLQIREVLKLNTGSIVELNRLVVEPVDVIVNDCVIARGEVVVVDGNYGVRVTELASREDRMRFGISQTSARVAVGAGGGV